MQPPSLRDDADIAIAKRGAMERSLLQDGTSLIALKQKHAVSTSGGFSAKNAKKSTVAVGKKKKKVANKNKVKGKVKRRLSTLAAELERSGVVRIDGALSEDTTTALREFCDAERRVAEADVASSKCDSSARFADLVLLENRCDLLMPLRGPCIDALHELLGAGSVLGPLLTEVVGDGGMLQEIACLISSPGSKQQPLHPDTPWTETPPLYAAFIALQDVELEMGPTLYLPGTHTKEAHTAFYGGDLQGGRDTSGLRSPPICTEFLKSRKVVVGMLKAGDLALYNQQVLHCGSANESEDKVRRQFYVSFRNEAAAKVKARASIRPAFKDQLTLGQIREELARLNLEGREADLTDDVQGAQPPDEPPDEPPGKPPEIESPEIESPEIESPGGLFAALDRLDAKEDLDTTADRHQAGSLYISLEGGPVDLV